MLSFQLFQTGYCLQLERISRSGGAWRTIRFPATAALIHHPNLGSILFDTGYGRAFFAATDPWPYRLYRLTTPVHCPPEADLAAQLRRQGIAPESIRHIVLSHFHADHIGGLRDFRAATFHYLDDAYLAVAGLSGLPALLRGFLPALLPPDFAQRSRPIGLDRQTRLPQELEPFTQGYDLFGDGTLWGVPVPGHAKAQMGLFFQAGQQPVFLCADAAWSSEAYESNLLPHPLANLIMDDRQAYATTLQRLHQLHRNQPDLWIIPTHCGRWHEGGR